MWCEHPPPRFTGASSRVRPQSPSHAPHRDQLEANSCRLPPRTSAPHPEELINMAPAAWCSYLAGLPGRDDRETQRWLTSGPFAQTIFFPFFLLFSACSNLCRAEKCGNVMVQQEVLRLRDRRRVTQLFHIQLSINSAESTDVSWLAGLYTPIGLEGRAK